MAAPVRIEDEAFSDPRLELLGSICGYNRYEALGRMAHLWRYCTNKSLYVVSDATLIACLGPKGPQGIIEADLGEREANGSRVKGTRGRIEWLQSKREAGRSGGLAKASKREVVLEQTPSKSYPPTPTPTLEEDTETKGKKRSVGVSRFVPPTVEQVREYCNQRQNSVDPQRFIDFYESKGWVVGKSKMKDWRAAVRTWEQNETQPTKPTVQRTLTKHEADHGNHNFQTGEFQFNTKLCRDLECPDCKPKRATA